MCFEVFINIVECSDGYVSGLYIIVCDVQDYKSDFFLNLNNLKDVFSFGFF